MPDKPPTVVLTDYTDRELKDAIRAKEKIDIFQKRSTVEQLVIVLKHKGFSITAALSLLFGGGIYYKDPIKRILNPPVTISQEEYKVANSENYIILQQLELYNAAHTKKLQEVQDSVSLVRARLTIIESYFTE